MAFKECPLRIVKGLNSCSQSMIDYLFELLEGEAVCKLIDNCLLRELSDNILYSLRKVLNYYGENIDWFIRQIGAGNPVAGQMINDFAKYGMFHILIPLNEVISIYMPKEFRELWQEQWDNLKYNSTIVHSVAESFHTKMIEKSQYMGKNIAEVVKCDCGVHLYKKIWESYPESLLQYPQESSDIYLGMLIPGIYSVGLEQHYMDAVFEIAIPQLLTLKSRIVKFPRNKILQALIYEAVLCYSSELGWQYYVLTSKVAEKIIKKAGKCENDKQYAHLFESAVLSQSNIRLNMTPQRVEELEELSRCAEQFGFTEPSCRKLLYFIPVALQLVGKNQEASKKLIALHNQGDINIKTESVFLLAYYRMWVRGTGQVKKRASVILDGFNPGELDDILKLYQDIVDFYRQFCSEFAKRFDKKGLDELLAHSSECDLPFYQRWNPKDEWNIWFFNAFVESGILIQIFEFLLQKCEEVQTNVNEMLSWMYLLDSLYYPLVSHINPDPLKTLRVNVDMLLNACNEIILGEEMKERKLIPIGAPQNPEWEWSELFGLYSPSQIEVLEQLYRRMEEACRNRPKQVPKDIVQVLSEPANPPAYYRRATWDIFKHLNGDVHRQFENLCRDVFRKSYFGGDVYVNFHEDPNNCGTEISPTLSPKTGKRMSFQAKYFLSGRVDYTQFKESAEKIADRYREKLDSVVFYCNADISLKSKAFEKIVGMLREANIEIETVCNHAILDIVNADQTLMQRYFGGNLSE